MKRNYTKQILEDILVDGRLGRSLHEIAIRLNIPYEEFIKDYDNPQTQIQRYYNAGIIEGKTKTDDTVFKLALNGSTIAKKTYDDKQIESILKNKFKQILRP